MRAHVCEYVHTSICASDYHLEYFVSFAIWQTHTRCEVLCRWGSGCLVIATLRNPCLGIISNSENMHFKQYSLEPNIIFTNNVQRAYIYNNNMNTYVLNNSSIPCRQYYKCVGACVCACARASPSICMYVCMSVYLSVCLLACLPVYVSACLRVCVSACLRVCVSACLRVCVCACLRVCVSVCLPVCLSVCNCSISLYIYSCDFKVLHYTRLQFFWFYLRIVEFKNKSSNPKTKTRNGCEDLIISILKLAVDFLRYESPDY